MRIRDTESSGVPILQDIENILNIVDLQGLLIAGGINDLEEGLKNKRYDITLTGIEAVQLNDNEEFKIAFTKSFTHKQWKYKKLFCEAIDYAIEYWYEKRTLQKIQLFTKRLL